MVRSRFSTPTIGREWMVGEIGRAVTNIAPDGVVQMREALVNVAAARIGKPKIGGDGRPPKRSAPLRRTKESGRFGRAVVR
jgi:membrane-bound serine protease (ClpP class)